MKMKKMTILMRKPSSFQKNLVVIALEVVDDITASGPRSDTLQIGDGIIAVHHSQKTW